MNKFLFLVLGLTSIVSQAQLELSYEAIETTRIDADYFIGADRFDDLYYIKDQTLFMSKNGQMQNYANLQLGAIDQVKIFNNLKLAVLHKNFNTVVLLDNRLAELSVIDFNSQTPIRTVSNIAHASENNFWLFNTLTLELELYNYKTQKTVQKTLPLGEKVLALQSDYNNVVALTPTAIYHYNYTGSLISRIEHNGMEDFKLWGDVFILKKENRLFFKTPAETEIHILENSKKTIKQFFVMNQTLYIYDGQELNQYQLIKY